MEPSSDIHLSWSNHQTTLVSVFDALLTNEKLADCTVSAEGKSIMAHKIILAACSPYFERVFSENREKHPIIILPDVKFRVIRALLDFMYHGEMNVPQDDLGSVLRLSESFQLRGLSGSGYIGDAGTPREDGGSQLLIATENHSSQPTISSVFTLCSEETSDIEVMNSYEEDSLCHSSQGNTSARAGPDTRASRKRKKLTRLHSSCGDRQTTAINTGVDTVFQVSDAEETLPVLATLTDISDFSAVSTHPSNSKSRGSTEIATNGKRGAKKDMSATSNSPTTRKVAFDQVTCNEGASGRAALKTKFAGQIDTPVGIMKDVTLSGSADGNDSVGVSTAGVNADRGRAAKCRPRQLLKKQRRKRRGKFVCHSCEKSYVSRGGLARHLQYECGKEPQFECPRCKFLCFRRDLLKKHMSTHRCQNYLQVAEKPVDET